ncbi:MAG TPA: hypothetical protein DIW47_05920 [Bacteroidetes bacterium]|nr:hypothetical protein [Bacteroidota bacterium]
MLYEKKDIILHVEDLSIAYGDKVIIQNVSMMEHDVVREGKVQGQTIAVLGRSGRGKSTLFRGITGLVAAKSGRVIIPDYSKAVTDGLQPAKLVAEGDVGFVDQKYTLFRHKTILDALLFSMRNTNLSGKEKLEKAMSYLVEWGLENVKHQYPNELSGGQRQRVAIIEQLLSSGHYLVLDEPFSGLDVGNIKNAKASFDLIECAHELNTIIFSTHDIELAVELADSIYIVGYPKKPEGGLDTIGTIVAHFDLKKMGIAWRDGFDADHLELTNEIKRVMLES